MSLVLDVAGGRWKVAVIEWRCGSREEVVGVAVTDAHGLCRRQPLDFLGKSFIWLSISSGLNVG